MPRVSLPLSSIGGDLRRFEGSPFRTLLVERQHRWLLLYRVADHCKGNVSRRALGLLVRKYGAKIGFSIPLGTLGPELRLSHVGTIAINGAARIGRNCQLYQGVTLGGDSTGAPLIGDHVFIGPNVTVVGAVTIGDGVVLMAGANIRSDVPRGAVRGPIDDAKSR